MKLFNRISLAVTTLIVGLATLGLSFGGSVAAAPACFQYNQNGFPTQATPIFDNVCGVPNIGNESNFVRIRQNNAGNDESDLHLNDFTMGTLTNACTTGDKFDVVNYVHNDAYPQDNPDVNPNDPSAVAKGVEESLTATGANNQFKFGDTVTANNAATISNSVNLDCNGSAVTLSLVPKTVHIYSQAYSGSSDTGAWEDLPDGIVNGGPTPIGSTNAGASSDTSGTQWGCWTYTTILVYEVTTTVVPTPTVTQPTCNLLTLESSGQVAKIEKVNYTANSATVTGATVVFSQGTNNYTVNLNTTQLAAINSGTPYAYSLPTAGAYSAKATILTSLGNVTGANCVAAINTTVPPTTPPTTTPPATPPTQLVNTGPGSVIGIFAGVTALSAGAYRWFLGRRLLRS